MKLFSHFKAIYLPILLAAAFSSANANAVLISTSAGDYEVSTILTSYNANQDLLESQVWWDNVSLAQEFATLTNTVFGTPNLGVYAPFFWYTTTDTTGPCSGIGEPYAGVFWNTHSDRAAPVCAASAPTGPFTFAIAEAVTTAVPEPSTMSLLALGAFIVGFSRTRRRLVRN